MIDSGIFTTTGTLVKAVNIGGGAATFDGITFATPTGSDNFGTVVDNYYNYTAGNKIFDNGMQPNL